MFLSERAESYRLSAVYEFLTAAVTDAIILVAQYDTDIISYSSGGQKSDIGR